jgi:hypothetical protein
MPRMMKHDKGQENDKMAKREGKNKTLMAT